MKLKPCPFCGGMAILRSTYQYVRANTLALQYYVRCGNDTCELYVATCNRNTEEEAIEAWNRRVTDERAD